MSSPQRSREGSWFVQKWNLMAVIEKYPTIFNVGGGSGRALPFVTLTEKARKIASDDSEARNLMEPILAKKLRKVLMMSVDCRVPLEKIEFIENELGLPQGFKNSLIPKYPDFFSLKDINRKAYLQLENWDSSVAVIVHEERLALEGVSASNPPRKTERILKDGNFVGPFAFRMRFPAGFRPNESFLEQLERWQRMDFPSSYLNARFETADRKARKHIVAVLHELLSLTMEKRMTSMQLYAFHYEYLLPSRLLFCLIKHHGIFYITNRGAKSIVFLKEAYDGSSLVEKCPLLMFHDKFLALTGVKRCSFDPFLFDFNFEFLLTKSFERIRQ